MAETRKSRIRSQLAQALAKRLTVLIERHDIESADRFDGYILGVSGELVLVANINDGIHLDGYTILRIRDISLVEAPHTRHEFYKRALRIRGEKLRKPRGVKLANVQAAVQSVKNLSPLVSIFQEYINPDICHIGRIARFDKRVFELQTIDIHAHFDGESRTIDFSDVTRIDWGGGYEAALALAAGLESGQSKKPKRLKR